MGRRTVVLWRTRIKQALPYWLTCAISRVINPPLLADLHRSERIVEYAWVLGELGKRHPFGLPILDIGYAGSYLVEMECQFGPVVGVDPRRTPRIAHPQFVHRGPPTGPPYYPPLLYTGICVSVLEHLAREEAGKILETLGRCQQAFITVPLAPTAHQFKGYRPFTLAEIWDWPGCVEFSVYRREDGWWRSLNGAFIGVGMGQDMILEAIVEHLPESSEHQVNAVALVRLGHRPARPLIDEPPSPAPDSGDPAPPA